MVRNIVGTLIEIGEGKRKSEEISRYESEVRSTVSRVINQRKNG